MSGRSAAGQPPAHIELLDIGGEGKHEGAWNLNPSPVITLGPRKGTAIPNWIEGRAQQIPLASRSVDRIIMERTPLTREAIQEIARVIRPGGTVVLRHAIVPQLEDPHAEACRVLRGNPTQHRIALRSHHLQETSVHGCQPEQ